MPPDGDRADYRFPHAVEVSATLSRLDFDSAFGRNRVRDPSLTVMLVASGVARTLSGKQWFGGGYTSNIEVMFRQMSSTSVAGLLLSRDVSGTSCWYRDCKSCSGIDMDRCLPGMMMSPVRLHGRLHSFGGRSGWSARGVRDTSIDAVAATGKWKDASSLALDMAIETARDGSAVAENRDVARLRVLP